MELWHFGFLEGGIKTRKLAKIGLLNFSFWIYSRLTRKQSCWIFSGNSFEAFPASEKIGRQRSTSRRETIALNLVQPIPQPNPAQCTFCWQFEDQKDMYRALRGSSAIHPGTMCDDGPFLTTGDIIPPCKLQHRAKLLVDPKQQTVVLSGPLRDLCICSWVYLHDKEGYCIEQQLSTFQVIINTGSACT